MTDETGETGETEPDPTFERQQRAQSAAGDLARMGIDPRSLGLDAPSAPRPPQAPVVPEEEAAAPAEPANVVRLRPTVEETPAPSQPEPERTATRFEQAVARTGVPAARPDPMRVVGSVARTLATPDMAASVQQERALVESVRRRQTDRRRVAFVSGRGGVGCTSVAVGVGTTLVALREDRSVVIDLQQGTASLAGWVGAGDPTGVAALLRARGVPEVAAAPSGLAVVDGVGWEGRLDRATVSGLLERLGADHAFHLFDLGDDPGEGAHSALARADAVVLVSGPGPAGAAASAAVLDRVRYVNPQAAARVTSVLVCTHAASYRQAQRELAPGADGFPGLVVPPDPLLEGGDTFDPSRLAAATREAYLRVAAAVVAASETP